MSVLIAPPSRVGRALGPRASVRGAIVLLLALCIAAGVTLIVARTGAGTRQQAPGSSATIAPRLIVRAHTAPIAATLRGGLRVEGSLYPALPGRNTLRLSAHGVGEQVRGGSIDVTATMPGMAMAPARATLIARRGGYSGALTLPMFGVYRARIVVHTPSGQYSGAITIALSLPRE